MDKSGVKCFWQSQCPYYETITSYGTEIIECGNTDCPLYPIEQEREEQDD